MSTSETPTPRTDAQPPVVLFDHMGNEYEACLVLSDFARQLERELAAAKAEIDLVRNERARMETDLDWANSSATQYAQQRDAVCLRCGELEAELKAARADSERLDWLEAHGFLSLPVYFDHGEGRWIYDSQDEVESCPLREGIDAARAGGGK